MRTSEESENLIGLLQPMFDAGVEWMREVVHYHERTVESERRGVDEIRKAVFTVAFLLEALDALMLCERPRSRVLGGKQGGAL